MASSLEVSIVMPCLNEADTIEICIVKAWRALRENGIQGEVIVADNGSTDGSQAIATRLGARIVHVDAKGYGNALMGGIAAARGTFVIIGDADDSYDFLELPTFVEKLRQGFDLVQGCRLPSGGGRVLPGAMPLSHRWIGNPVFSMMARHMFRSPVHDVYCGLRAFTKEFYDRLDLRCTGMEFATEMIIKAGVYGARVVEVPITLSPDGRKSHAPHLKTFRDGWRTFRFFLMYSPRWLFLLPGALLLLMGALGYSLALPAARVRGAELDVNALLFSSLFIILGYQSILFAGLTKSFAVAQGLLPSTPRVERFFQVFNLERGLLAGAAVTLAGLVLLTVVMVRWWSEGFGPLDYRATLRLTIPGVTLTALGAQTVLSSFFASILGLRHR